MEILVNHLTRMQPGFFCAAGIDTATGRHIRPVLRGRIPVQFLATHGGPFAIGAVLDLGPVIPCGHAPETEDHRFLAVGTRRISIAAPEEFWNLLEQSVQPTLSTIFGSVLQPCGQTCAVDAGRGQASLGCLRSKRVSGPEIFHGAPRLNVDDGTFKCSLPITDIRLFEGDFSTLNRVRFRQMQKAITRGDVILAVGLTRPWRKPDDDRERHWLQVNNIHPADNPLFWDK